MRAAPIISLILSVVIGIVAVVFGRSWIDSEAEASRQPTSAEVVVQEVETEMILVAADLIERGDHLEESSLTLVEWPKELLPEDALTNAEEILSDDGAYPFANGLIASGEPILKAKVALRQPRDTLATVI
ncbi:MAG: SAF domain-containing protein, partial [Pseudomonadota bacterium]